MLQLRCWAHVVVFQNYFLYVACMLQSYAQSWATCWPALPLALIETEAVQMKYILLAFFDKGAYRPLDAGHSSIWWWMTKSRRDEEAKEWGDTKRDGQSGGGEEAVFQSHLALGVSLTNPDASLLSKPSASMFSLHSCWWNNAGQMPARMCVFITCMKCQAVFFLNNNALNRTYCRAAPLGWVHVCLH